MSELLLDQLTDAAAGAVAAPPAIAPEAQRGLSIAILRARAGCCNVCEALLPLQDALFRQLEQGSPPAPIPTIDANGTRGELAPLSH